MSPDGWGTGQAEKAPAPSPSIVPEPRKKKQGVLGFLIELPILIVVAFGIALIIKTFVVQAFFIPSGSMEPTLLPGDRVLVSKFIYRFADPKRGDILVFRSEETPPVKVKRGLIGSALNWILEGLGLRSNERDLIKRVIATGNQTVQLHDGAVYVNDHRLKEPYLPPNTPLPDFGPYHVPAHSIFVMGDNRGNSRDSRVFGAVRESSIVGRAFLMIWPLNRIGGL